MFVAELAELVFPPFPPPPLDTFASRTAVFGTSSKTLLSPLAIAGSATAAATAAISGNARRLPTMLRMFPPFRVVVQTRTERVMRFSAERKTRICRDFVD